MIGFGLVAKYFITPKGRSLFYYLCFPTKTLRWHVCYFVEKIRCSTSIYSYDKKDISEDLAEMEKQYAEDWEDDAEQLAESLNFHYEKGMTVQQIIYDELEPVRDYFEDTKVSDDTVYPDNVQDILSEFNPDWWNDGTAPIGRRISRKIYLWIAGYEMLCEQLGI